MNFEIFVETVIRDKVILHIQSNVSPELFEIYENSQD